MGRKHLRFARVHGLSLTLLIAAGGVGTAYAAQSFIGGFNTVTPISTTMPANNDVNPYGIVVVPESKGKLVEGQILISNFNNSDNHQGTGTTIVEIAPNGTLSLFAQIDPATVSCPGGIGLTTALVALRSGFVIVGSLPTTDGTSATAKAGCLIVLDSNGNVVETFSGHNINGPWDMTALDGGPLAVLFVTNVLNGTVEADGKVVKEGTVVRLLLGINGDKKPELLESMVIATSFPERTDPGALVIGPTGVVFDEGTGTLYVADSLDNRIAAISDALFRQRPSHAGETVSQGKALNDPLGLAATPGGHLLAANGNDGNIVEINPANGQQVAVKLVDNTGGPPPGAGALFGLVAISDGVYFVDDNSNMLELLH